jgi:hypothetical protein
MALNRVHYSSVHNNWSTPKDVYDTLNEEFKFNDDPCPLLGSGGLSREWGSSVFINPPYSALKKWLSYAYQQNLQGKTIVALIPSRTDTRWWHDYVMKATEIRFIKGRLKFGGAKFNAPFPSCVVVFK